LRVEPGSARIRPASAGHHGAAVIGAGRELADPSEEPVELGPGHYVAYPGDVPHICDALEAGSTVVMALEHVQEGVQNAAPVPGPDRCPRAG
jgi:hypothetical protein